MINYLSDSHLHDPELNFFSDTLKKLSFEANSGLAEWTVIDYGEYYDCYNLVNVEFDLRV